MYHKDPNSSSEQLNEKFFFLDKNVSISLLVKRLNKLNRSFLYLPEESAKIMDEDKII
jgi:hypothetical protein